ncbi:hypothetical protein EJ02DRAFT_424970 [Clathrospora elynae]|uniref:DUF2423 domain-containing protein n=1 Tax=Clathrospora elynae TaxID=706981 RepID=A0A6A5SFA2_9PLEO|nr:hypothetical protein EJ02DRAFT_424970 [Clathrospora elynae]
MAKGLRSSSRKANNTKLRERVFAPVEKARAERLHAKLLEAIQQPKPEKTEMDVTDDATTTDEAAKEDDLPKGSFLLTASIPRSLSDPANSQLNPAQEQSAMRNLYFHLGLCSDILGFTDDGDLTLAFDLLPPHWLNMDVDGAAKTAKATKKTSNKNKNVDKSQSRKQLRRRPQNKVSFPASRGKGALKPFTSGTRVSKRRS